MDSSPALLGLYVLEGSVDGRRVRSGSPARGLDASDERGVVSLQADDRTDDGLSDFE